MKKLAIAALLASAGAAHAADTLSGRDLYWVDPSPLVGGVWTGPADGSTRAKKIYSTGQNPDGLAIEKATRRIYFTNMTLLSSRTGNVKRGDLVNGKIANLVDIVPDGWGLKTPKQLVLDEVNRKVYFADREGRRIYRAPMDGVKAKRDLEILVDFTSAPDTEHQFVGVAVDLDRNQFYWTDRLTNTIWRAPTNLPVPVTLANADTLAKVIVTYPSSRGMMTDLHLDNRTRHLYWSDRGEGNEIFGTTLPAGFIARIDLDTPFAPMEVVVPNLLKDPVGLVVDSANGVLYFANTEDGRVFSVPLSGGTPKELHKSVLGAGLTLVDWQD